MKRASLISVGNELLSGLTIDTNSAFLGGQLQRLGLEVVSRYTVPDELTAIKRALTLASQDADAVLLTGGLGPTDDDLSRQGMAQFLGVELKMKENLLDTIKAMFEARGLKMPARNRVQACLPEG
ncbi:MAG: competence/damage-inducible protein A, partial [Planctomycetes bacterium]|nr:competence/damage-inducible protein A [Planctomycetota bacterium]